jgi:hypothetical protein
MTSAMIKTCWSVGAVIGLSLVGACGTDAPSTTSTATASGEIERALVQAPAPALGAARTLPHVRRGKSVLTIGGAGLEDDQIADGADLGLIRAAGLAANNGDGGGILGRQANGSVLGIDTIPSFSSYFYQPGAVPTAFGDFAQFTWPYTMVGRPPFGKSASEHTTTINAPIVPVNIDLRNADGSPRYFTRPDGTQVRMYLDATQYVTPVLQSPIFQNAWYSSTERKTQFNDAVHRAQFFHQSDDDWHTRLNPAVKAARTMVLIRGSYRFSINITTGQLRYVLVDQATFNNALFPASSSDTSSVMGIAENSGDVTPADISTFRFPNTFLYQGDPSACCVLGFHSYDTEPGNAANGWREKHYVMNYSSWISAGLFGGGFEDITALSHELAETFSDPFVNNATPIWVAPNGLCQNNLESGDVIEGLANATFPMTMNGMTYHPQNEALLQWFAGQSPSSAIAHAYSYPDTTVLTSPAISLFSDCATPASFLRNRP